MHCLVNLLFLIGVLAMTFAVGKEETFLILPYRRNKTEAWENTLEQQ
jgi:hypothetical protein